MTTQDTAVFRDTIILQSVRELVSLAALALDARFAILRLFDGTVIANDDAAPIEAEAELAERVPGIRFYTAAPVLDADGRALGTLVVLDQGMRELTWSNHQILLQLGKQIARLFDVDVRLESVDAQLRRLETIIDALPLAAYVMENGRFATVNARFARALGYTKDELLAMESVTQIVVAEEQEFVRETLRRREAGEQNDVRYITQIRARDGRICDAELHGSVAYVNGRRLLIGAAVDITVHSQERRRMLEREEHFRALTENVSDIIAILDGRGLISYVTPSVERMLGYQPDELTGKDYSAFVHPDDRERVSEACKAMRRAPLASFSSPAYRFRASDGSWRELESVGTNLLNHPQVRGLVLNTRDVTDRKLLEQQVDQLHRLTSLGRLSAQVAHEFNNVLMGIQPFAEVVHRHSDDPRLIAAGDAIVAAIGRGKRITTDILRFGRPAELAGQTVNVSSVIRQAVEEIRPALPSNVTLETAITESSLYVHGDGAQLAQVLINLMLNALDAMRANGGTLAVTARSSEGHDLIHVTVRDTGEGIADQDLPYIFEPLFTTKRTGTGLGLSVVWQIVGAHHGRVSAESVPGLGTTLHVDIPAVAEPSERSAAGAPLAHRKRQAGEKVHVLLVEDDPSVAGGLQMSLESEAFEVSVAACGAEVMPRILERKPDVVVLDLSLPDEDGRSIYERIVALSPLPVIFSSGQARDTDVAQILDNPRTAFLMKPYATEELLRTIDRLLERKEPEHELPN
jgi:PAS domain S-box-containing protein